MADEFINIVDDKGKSTGEVTLKSEAHRLGLFHSSVHIWFYTENGELLIQKRAASKDTFPNLWDVSVAGHISAGESSEQAAVREIREEIGLPIAADFLKFTGVYLEQKKPRIHIIDNEFHYIYLAELTVSVDMLDIQEEEVSAIKLIAFDDFKNHLEDKYHAANYVPHDQKYYDFVINELSKVIGNK